jgi:hypothetical protein
MASISRRLDAREFDDLGLLSVVSKQANLPNAGERPDAAQFDKPTSEINRRYKFVFDSRLDFLHLAELEFDRRRSSKDRDGNLEP